MTVSANVSSILRQIAGLSLAERTELQAGLETQPAAGLTTSAPAAADPKDEAAFKWINAHAAEFQGQWLALDGDRLLAHGANLIEVAAAARTAGVQFPLLHLVEPPREHPYIRS